MVELEHTTLSKSELLARQSQTEQRPSDNPLIREGQLLYQGISSIPGFAKEVLDEPHRSDTIKNALLSAGLTFSLSCLKRSPGLAWTAGQILLPALLISSSKDIITHAGEVKDALVDNWHSARNWQHNAEIMKEHVGRFGVDFAISTVASGLAERAGRSYFSLKTPGVDSLPELKLENLRGNWKKHMAGEVVPYKLFSRDGGGMRQVDLFVPPSYQLPDNQTSLPGFRSNAGLLIAPDGLKLGFGLLKNLQVTSMAQTNGLANLRRDPGLNYVAAFPHAKTFRVLPGLNLATWHHDAGLITPGGWLAPRAEFSDVNFMADIEKTVTKLLGTRGTTLAGFSSGGILANETAARLGPERVQAVVSVASTINGLEPPARAGQFRLIVRNSGDPTLPEAGGVGKSSSVLSALGHKVIRSSNPQGLIGYGLKPYSEQVLLNKSEMSIGLLQKKFALANGEPVVSYVRLDDAVHDWPKRISGSKSVEFDLNQMIKNIVNKNWQNFQIQNS